MGHQRLLLAGCVIPCIVPSTPLFPSHVVTNDDAGDDCQDDGDEDDRGDDPPVECLGVVRGRGVV